MQFIFAVPAYGVWHYTKGFKDLWHNWIVFLFFIARLFSPWALLRTLFSPWRRLAEPYKRGLNVEAFFSTLIVNLITRIIGFIVRFFTIIVGLFAIALAFLAGFLTFVIWALMPIIILILLGSGLGSLLA